MSYQYICPICLRKEELNDPFPKCCGHYMVELRDWEAHKEKWLIARDYELSLLCDEETNEH